MSWGKGALRLEWRKAERRLSNSWSLKRGGGESAETLPEKSVPPPRLPQQRKRDDLDGLWDDDAFEQKALQIALTTSISRLNHQAGQTGMLVDLVLAVDRPRAFVFRISPRATDSTAAENNRWADIVLESAYAKALLDPLPPRGRIARWLLDHAALRNRAPHLRSRLIGEGALPERASGAMDPERGYRSREPRVLNQRMRDHQRAIVRDWRTAPAYADALDTAIGAAQSAGARVLLVDAPQRGALLELMASPERNLQGGRRTLQAAAERTGAASAFVPPDLVSDRDFADYTHLLAGAIARELPDF